MNIKAKIKKLSLFDKALVALFIVLGLLFIYVFFRKSAYITVTVKIGEEDATWERWSKPWYSKYFYKGMKERGSLGTVNADVLDVRSYDVAPMNILYSNPANNIYSVKKAIYLTLKLKVVYNRSNNQFTYQGLPVLIGSPIKLYLDRTFVSGLVTGMEGIKDTRDKQTLIVEARIKRESQTYLETSGSDTYIADALTVGQKVLDDQGNLMIEIVKKRVEDAKRLTTTADGRTIISANPLKKDIYLTLKVYAFKMGDKYYLFDDVPILIGYPIPFNTPTTSVLPEVMSIRVE
jgi:hypothetical protein